MKFDVKYNRCAQYIDTWWTPFIWWWFFLMSYSYRRRGTHYIQNFNALHSNCYELWQNVHLPNLPTSFFARHQHRQCTSSSSSSSSCPLRCETNRSIKRNLTTAISTLFLLLRRRQKCSHIFCFEVRAERQHHRWFWCEQTRTVIVATDAWTKTATTINHNAMIGTRDVKNSM